MYRAAVIVRHTFREAVVQPIFGLVLALGAVIILVFGFLPFFTLGEDTVMFKAVSLDVILLLVLIATLFATSKSIYDEIEDRTMLTLMSKPVRRWEVLVGKYLGISLAALLAVAALGAVLVLSTYGRVPSDYLMSTTSLDERDIKTLWDTRRMHLAGLVPSLLLTWLQISVLAAVSVAISTRVSLVVNLPAVILVYLAGNLTRFLYTSGGAGEDRPLGLRVLAAVVSNVVPYLETFDIRDKAIYSTIALADTVFARDVSAVTLGEIWGYAGVAGLYALAYSAFALLVGLLLFQTRELGGGEG